MSTTNELRRLLDERGVEWKEYKFNPWTDTTAWDIDTSDPRYGVEAGFEEFDDGVTLLRFWNATPEQAIAATLGADAKTTQAESSGTCTADETEIWECVCDGMGHYGKRLTVHVMECSECGHTYEHVNGSYEFCPRCGRRILNVEESDG